MKSQFRILAALMLGTLPSFALAQPIPVRVLVESGHDQTVAVNQVVATPFVARVVHATTGEPVPNVPLIFFVNFRLCIPGDPNCNLPPQALYGQFVSPGAEEVITNDEGLATAPAFRAGSVAGNYNVAAMLGAAASPPNEPSYVANTPDTTARFELRQVGGVSPAQPVPGPGPLALALLALAFLLGARLTFRRANG